MAYGDTVVLQSGGKSQRYVPTGFQFPSLSVLNPNDGVLYVSNNRAVESVAYGSWDWKVPSQSYAVLPGPWLSVGMLYVDQSGAGRSGEIISYYWTERIKIPIFYAIGRALAAASTAMDITQGTVPANPPAGTDRLWADASGNLWVVLSDGSTFKLADSNDPLGGVLTGTLPNPGMAANAVAGVNILDGAVSSSKIQNKTIVELDVVDGIIGLNSSLIQDGAINATKMQPKTIGATQIADGSLNGTLVADGSLSYADLAANSITMCNSMQGYAGASTTSTSPVIIPGFSLPLTTLAACPTVLRWQLPLYTNVSVGIYLYTRFDGGGWTAVTFYNSRGSSLTECISGEYWYTGLAAGAHTFDLGWQLASAGTLTQNGASPSVFSVIEHRR